MDHLNEAQLYSYVFDGAALADDDRLHLQGCVTCQQAVQSIQLMASELTIARRSEPKPDAQQRYASLFVHVQRQPSLLQQLWQGMRATLAWDSRRQPALQGVRSATAAAYRLLYETPWAAIELLVEPNQELRHLEGEVALEDGQTAAPALVQLVAPDGIAQQETETNEFGRFRLYDVAPGAYDLLLTLASGELLAVRGLEIT